MLEQNTWRTSLPSGVWSHERAEERHVVLKVMVFHVIYQVHSSLNPSFDTIQPLETRINYI